MGILICDICGENEAYIHRITRRYDNNKSLFIIENIPVVSYSSCDESYLTAETMHEIENIKMHQGIKYDEKPKTI
jgi:YgiT-type zinc finger domain-containing protein